MSLASSAQATSTISSIKRSNVRTASTLFTLIVSVKTFLTRKQKQKHQKWSRFGLAKVVLSNRVCARSSRALMSLSNPSVLSAAWQEDSCGQQRACFRISAKLPDVILQHSGLRLQQTALRSQISRARRKTIRSNLLKPKWNFGKKKTTTSCFLLKKKTWKNAQSMKSRWLVCPKSVHMLRATSIGFIWAALNGLCRKHLLRKSPSF